MAASMASSSLTPPRARNLMPLSGIGLCEALMTTPRSASSAAVRWATPGVGSTRSRSTSTPADARPATTACSRNCPEIRESRPTTARGRSRVRSYSPRAMITRAAATDRSRASSAVTSRFARPRTPSVPKMRGIRVGSALGVLGRLAGLLESGLLALDDPGVTREQPGLLERRPVGLLVDEVQAPGHAEAQRAGLAGDATAVDPGDHVEAALELQCRERLVDDLLVQLVGEVGVEGTAVDRPLAGAGDDAHPGHSLLAAAGGRCGGDGRRAGGGVGGRRALGAVGHALLVDL